MTQTLVLQVPVEDRATLEAVLYAHSLDDVCNLVEVGPFMELTLHCPSDEQEVIADLTDAGVDIVFSFR